MAIFGGKTGDLGMGKDLLTHIIGMNLNFWGSSRHPDIIQYIVLICKYIYI